jgi:hypothetical protein
VTGTGHTTSWERVEIDLSQYSGNRDVRFMFVMDEERDQNSYCGDNSGVANGWWIDDIRLENRISGVTLNPLTEVSMHGATCLVGLRIAIRTSNNMKFIGAIQEQLIEIANV